MDMSEFEGVPLERAIIRSYNVTSQDWKESEIFVKIAKEAFSQGALRKAHRMLRYENEADTKPVIWVAKIFMKPPENGTKAYEDDIILQTVSKFYGQLFNELDPPKKVEFMDALIMKMAERDEIYAIEPYIVGEYTKHSNNVGFIDFEHWRNTPHAFSHFTYEASNRRELVCDIQGVNDLYTDPQVHSVEKLKYGTGNLGRKGIALFFYTHRCNPLCSLFKLPQFEHFNVIETINRDRIQETISKPDSPKRLALWKGTTMTKSFDKILRVMQERKSSQIDLRRSISRNSMLALQQQQQQQQQLNKGSRPNVSDIKSAYRSMSPAHNPDESSKGFEYLPVPSSFNVDLENAELVELAKIHRELADLHEHGRLSLLDKMMYQFDFDDNAPNADDAGDQPQLNFPAVFFHYQKAAEYGDITSMLILARIHSGTARDILPDVKLENPNRAFKYLKLAAKKGHLSASFHTAQCYHHGYFETEQHWPKAVQFYDNLLTVEFKKDSDDDNIHGFNLDKIVIYEVASYIAQMYEDGGYELEPDYPKAAEYYRMAADDAMENMKGKLAAQFYEKAEICDSM